jgi:hypothetical protein
LKSGIFGLLSRMKLLSTDCFAKQESTDLDAVWEPGFVPSCHDLDFGMLRGFYRLPTFAEF